MLSFQVDLQRLNLDMNVRRHNTQGLVMSCVENPHQRGNLNLPTTSDEVQTQMNKYASHQSGEGGRAMACEKGRH